MNLSDLASEVSDVLELPRLVRRGESWEITNAVVRAIVEGLYRGEDVRIDGFGIFRVFHRAPRRHGCYFFPYLGKGHHVEVNTSPAKNVVKFLPARTLRRLINEQTKTNSL